MSARNREPDSSLELLLDTMCNTFGGVMFIAIALVVLMSMMSTVSNTFISAEAELQKMEKELEELKAENRKLQEYLVQLENHPNKKQIRELLLLQKNNEERKLRIEFFHSRVKIADAKFLLLRQKTDEAMRKRDELKKKRGVLVQELQQQNTNLLKMRKSSYNSTYAMTFRVMEKRKEAPYILLVSHDRVWRVGPDMDEKTGYCAAHPDCISEKDTDRGLVYCKPGKTAGIPILQNGSISSEMESLLQTIPSERLPLFSLTKDSIGSFCILREYMKKRKILHGVDASLDRNGRYCYNFSQEQRTYSY